MADTLKKEESMTDQEFVSSMVEKARAAQRVFETFSQEQCDAMARAAALIIYEHAEELARMDIEESQMGNLEDKIVKNASAAEKFWWHMKNKKSRGVLRRLDEIGIVEVAKPMGVIGTITPVTSAVVSPLHGIMCCLKDGNALIIAPHPRAKKTGKRTVELVNEAIRPLGAPENLIQVVEEPTIDISKLVMSTVDVCISTGGLGLVKTAYQSGKPAYGVGQGNVQCLVDRGQELDEVAEMVIQAREFENGLPCSCEQFIHVPEEELKDFTEKLIAHNAYYITDPVEVGKIRKISFPDGTLNKDIVGKKPYEIAKAAGVTIPDDTRALYVLVEKYGKDELLAKEKLFPVAAVRAYKTWEEAVDAAEENLCMEGAGHSTAIHSNDKERIEYAAEHISVSRFAINAPATKCVGGTLTNGMAPTGTLGCGSWGNNSISDNLDYKHLYNVARIIYEPENAVMPTHEEIWA